MARILVVDWEEEERVRFWSVLEKAGHDLLFAGDGQTALDVWDKEKPDLVLTELYIPDLNGLRLIKEGIGNLSTLRRPGTPGRMWVGRPGGAENGRWCGILGVAVGECGSPDGPAAGPGGLGGQSPQL